MNDYRDQVTWFDLQVSTTRGYWITISDHDTRESAESRALGLDLPADSYRVKQVHGLPE